MRFATWVSFMAFIAIGFCVSRRRNATKSSKCLLKSGLGHTKMRCPIQRKEAFKCLYCHKEFNVSKFWLGTQIRNLIREIRKLIMEFYYEIVAMLICIKFSIKDLNSLNKLRFVGHCVTFKIWERRGVTPRWLTERRAI